MYESLSLHLNGAWIAAGRETLPVFNPATEEEIGRLPCAGADDLTLAIESAARAFESWRDTGPMDRARVLRRVGALLRERAADIARNMTLDQGKPLAEALAEVTGCAEHADWHAGECRRIYGRTIPARAPNVTQMVLREPVGVCAAFTPWNFPLNQAIRKVCAALGAGCAVIVKGPEEAPSALIAMARAFQDAGLPPGCLNLVWGEPATMSQRLIADPAVAKISFTGSVAVGKKLAALAGAQMKRATMELGGHAPVLVFDDAEVERASGLMATIKCVNAGQMCISPTRFFVQEGVFKRFLDAFVAVQGQVRLGDGLAEGTQMGPLANPRRLEAMAAFVDDARARGGQVVIGGARLPRRGWFFPPTVLTGLDDDALAMNEEPFGPLSVVTPFKTLEEVLPRANRLRFGLAGYAFTASSRTAAAVTRGLNVGMLGINHFGLGGPDAPFGGVKDSGYGVEGGAETFDSYLTTKFVSRLD